MDKVIPINKNKKISKGALQLYNLGINIDNLIIEYLNKGFNPIEIGAILGDRIGELSKQVENKEQLIEIVISVMKKRAGI